MRVVLHFVARGEQCIDTRGACTGRGARVCEGVGVQKEGEEVVRKRDGAFACACVDCFFGGGGLKAVGGVVIDCVLVCVVGGVCLHACAHLLCAVFLF